MATLVEAVPGGWGRRAGHSARDYAQLFDGHVWALHKGKDFRGKPLGTQQGLYRKARALGIKVRSRIVNDVVYAQAITAAQDWTAAAEAIEHAEELVT